MVRVGTALFGARDYSQKADVSDFLQKLRPFAAMADHAFCTMNSSGNRMFLRITIKVMNGCRQVRQESYQRRI